MNKIKLLIILALILIPITSFADIRAYTINTTINFGDSAIITVPSYKNFKLKTSKWVNVRKINKNTFRLTPTEVKDISVKIKTGKKIETFKISIS